MVSTSIALHISWQSSCAFLINAECWKTSCFKQLEDARLLCLKLIGWVYEILWGITSKRKDIIEHVSIALPESSFWGVCHPQRTVCEHIRIAPRTRGIGVAIVCNSCSMLPAMIWIWRCGLPEVGYGIAAVTSSFFPMAPPDVQDEPEEGSAEVAWDSVASAADDLLGSLKVHSECTLRVPQQCLRIIGESWEMACCKMHSAFSVRGSMPVK